MRSGPLRIGGPLPHTDRKDLDVERAYVPGAGRPHPCPRWDLIVGLPEGFHVLDAARDQRPSSRSRSGEQHVATLEDAASATEATVGALETGRLSFEDAGALAESDDDPETQAELLDTPSWKRTRAIIEHAETVKLEPHGRSRSRPSARFSEGVVARIRGVRRQPGGSQRAKEPWLQGHTLRRLPLRLTSAGCGMRHANACDDGRATRA